jgi:hypothetical protein
MLTATLFIMTHNSQLTATFSLSHPIYGAKRTFNVRLAIFYIRFKKRFELKIAISNHKNNDYLNCYKQKAVFYKEKEKRGLGVFLRKVVGRCFVRGFHSRGMEE